MPHISEYEVETKFIDRLESIGYHYAELGNYDDVLANCREQLAAFNAVKLKEAKGSASFSDAEWNRVLIHLDNHSVYESAKLLRDKYVLTLDNGKTVYLDFFSYDTGRNIYQVAHQITMDPAHRDDVSYKNRYDVTILINGLPLIQVELKRPGVEINEAINQINRYRKFSFKGLFRYLQLFVVSNSVQTKYFCNENEMQDGMYNPILKSLVFFWTDDKNNLKGYALEEFVADLLRVMGYRTTVSPQGGDSGIDITAYKDELPPRILVQVKSQDSDIKETIIQSLKGAMREGDYGLFVTLSNYTKNAQKYLDNTPIIRGINGSELVDLILKYYDGLEDKYKRMIPLKMVYIPIPKEE